MRRTALRTVTILGLSGWAIASGCSGSSGSAEAGGDSINVPNGGNDNSGVNDNIGDDQNSGDAGFPDVDGGASEDDADGIGGAAAGAAGGSSVVGGGGAASHPQDGDAPERLVNFETLPDGSTLAASTVITDQFADLGVTFSSDQGGGIVLTNGEESSPPNFLVGNPGSFTPIVADFSEPVPLVYVTLISVGDAVVTVTALDAAMNPVDRAAITNPGTDNGFGRHDPIALRGTDIARIRFEITTSYPGDGFGIDDVAF